MPADPHSDETLILRALANPARQAILDQLARAPATSAMLARALASNTGVTSYHLRELCAARLIERDDQRSRGREVYWRLSHEDVRFRDPSTSDQPLLARAAIDLLLSRLVSSVRHYVTRSDLDPAWRDAALFSQSSAQLTMAELAHLQHEYLALIQAYTSRHRPPVGARPVRLALFAYPDDPGNSDDSDDSEPDDPEGPRP